MQLILLLVVVSLVCLTLQIPALSAASEWQIDGIEQGQWLRILSGNFTHTNVAHLVMNVTAMWIIAFIFQPSVKSYSLLLVLGSVGVGICLLFTSIQSYVGLSGTLHAMFAYYALREALQGRRSSWLLVLGVIVKVVWEHIFGSPLSTAAIIEAPVAIDAHLYGVVCGLILASICYLSDKNAD